MDVFLSIVFIIACVALGALVSGVPAYLFFRLLSRSLKKHELV